MAHFMGQDTGQLAVCIQVFEQSLGDEDLPPGQGKSVDCVCIGQQMKFVCIGSFCGVGFAGIKGVVSLSYMTCK